MNLAHESAAGAPLQDIIPATIVGIVALALLVAFGVAHRRGRVRLLTRLGAFGERVTGLPPWAAVSAAIAGGALLVAAFGFYADVATHIDNGRDPGPFANPFHYLIIGGLAGCALAGYVVILLGRDQQGSAIRIRDDWYAPVGGVLLLLCGGIAVLGFPLDDVWHRLFGQDVTLWSPTHIQMVGGASLSTLALWILMVESRRAAGAEQKPHVRWLEMFIAGSFLIGLSALHAEFDFSVPQFRLLYQPVLLMGSAGVALVAARIRLGRGGALGAVAVFLVVRGIVSMLVGPMLGHTTLHFPLYIAEAAVVEGIALLVSTKRQITFGMAAGVGIGTVGLAAEWWWSHVWMTMSWPASLGAEAVVLGLLAAVAGSLIGAFIGRALLDPDVVRQRAPRGLGLAAAAAMLFVLAYPFPTTGAVDGSTTIEVEPSSSRPGWARLNLALDPPSVADDSEWFVVTAWQGGGSVVEELRPVGAGRYESVPVPVEGEWKTLLRLHDDRALAALPIYLPEDPVIPAEGVAAPDGGEERAFVSDKELLLREAKPVSKILTVAASSALALLVIGWLAAIGWGLAFVEAPQRVPRWNARMRSVFAALPFFRP